MKFPAFEPIDLKNNVDAIAIEELDLTYVSPNINQPRKNFDANALQELSLSIKQYGVIQPIIVRKITKEKYEIIAGERRWRASKLAGLKVIPAIIQTNEGKKNLAISLIENIQREALNPIELAESFQKLSDEYGLSHENIASMVGKSRVTVTNILRLLNLSAEVRELLILGRIEMGHARALLSLPKNSQIECAKNIIEENLTVRDIEKIVKTNKKLTTSKLTNYEHKMQMWMNKLSNSLSSKVTININNKGSGKLIVHFRSADEADKLVEQFVNIENSKGL